MRGGLLVQDSDGVGLIHGVAASLRFNVKFVKRALGHARDETFPDSGGSPRLQPVRFRIPGIKAAHHRDRPRIRRPHAEHRPGLVLLRDQMRSHLVVQPVVAALVEKIEILVGKKLGRCDCGLGFGAHVRRKMCARRAALVYRKRTLNRCRRSFFVCTRETLIMYIRVILTKQQAEETIRMATARNRAHKHFQLDAGKIKRAQKVFKAKN